MTEPVDLASRLRAWAKGMYSTEAAVELLVRHGRLVYDGALWIRGTTESPWIDPAPLLEEAGLSGSERRVAAIAANLLGGPDVDLVEVLSSLDPHTLAVVTAALTLTGGGTPWWPRSPIRSIGDSEDASPGAMVSGGGPVPPGMGKFLIKSDPSNTEE